jgi:hypothetical protein
MYKAILHSITFLLHIFHICRLFKDLGNLKNTNCEICNAVFSLLPVHVTRLGFPFVPFFPRMSHFLQRSPSTLFRMLKCPTFWFCTFVIHITAITQFLCLLNRWLVHSVFVVFHVGGNRSGDRLVMSAMLWNCSMLSGDTQKTMWIFHGQRATDCVCYTVCLPNII